MSIFSGTPRLRLICLMWLLMKKSCLSQTIFFTRMKKESSVSAPFVTGRPEWKTFGNTSWLTIRSQDFLALMSKFWEKLIDYFLRNEEEWRVQKKMRFICAARYLCFCVRMVWRVRRPATCLSSGQFVEVVSQKNFQIILWMDFWLNFRDTL